MWESCHDLLQEFLILLLITVILYKLHRDGSLRWIEIREPCEYPLNNINNNPLSYGIEPENQRGSNP